MNEEIIKRLKDSLDYEFQLSFKDRKQLLDYITDLQTDNIALVKNSINCNSNYFRKIYKLQQENKKLIENQINSNSEHFRIITENKRKIDNLRKQNKELKYIIERNDNKIKTAEYLNIEYKKLLQENEILRKNAEHNDKVVDKARWNEIIYKSRCQKAMERLTLNGDIQEKDVIEVFANAIRDTRNILNGSDEK